VDWIGLAQNRDRGTALVHSVMNLRVLEMLGNYRVSTELLAYRVALSSVEIVMSIFILPTMEMRSVVLADGMAEVHKAKQRANCLSMSIRI
jgi:hypothetical protein